MQSLQAASNSTRATLPSSALIVGPFSLKQSSPTVSGVTLQGLGNTWRSVGSPRSGGGGGGGSWGSGAQPSLISPQTCFVSTLRPGNKIQLSMLKPALVGDDKTRPLLAQPGDEKALIVSRAVMFARAPGAVPSRPAWKTIGGMNIVRGARSIRPEYEKFIHFTFSMLFLIKFINEFMSIFEYIFLLLAKPAENFGGL